MCLRAVTYLSYIKLVTSNIMTAVTVAATADASVAATAAAAATADIAFFSLEYI